MSYVLLRSIKGRKPNTAIGQEKQCRIGNAIG